MGKTLNNCFDITIRNNSPSRQVVQLFELGSNDPNALSSSQQYQTPAYFPEFDLLAPLVSINSQGNAVIGTPYTFSFQTNGMLNDGVPAQTISGQVNTTEFVTDGSPQSATNFATVNSSPSQINVPHPIHQNAINAVSPMTPNTWYRFSGNGTVVYEQTLLVAVIVFDDTIGLGPNGIMQRLTGLTIGQSYDLTVNFNNGTTPVLGQLNFYQYSGTTLIQITTITGTGQTTISFTANTSSDTIMLRSQPLVPITYAISISVVQTTTAITLGLPQTLEEDLVIINNFLGGLVQNAGLFNPILSYTRWLRLQLAPLYINVNGQAVLNDSELDVTATYLTSDPITGESNGYFNPTLYQTGQVNTTELVTDGSPASLTNFATVNSSPSQINVTAPLVQNAVNAVSPMTPNAWYRFSGDGSAMGAAFNVSSNSQVLAFTIVKGIMQTLTGLTIGQSYDLTVNFVTISGTLNFYQYSGTTLISGPTTITGLGAQTISFTANTSSDTMVLENTAPVSFVESISVMQSSANSDEQLFSSLIANGATFSFPNQLPNNPYSLDFVNVSNNGAISTPANGGVPYSEILQSQNGQVLDIKSIRIDAFSNNGIQNQSNIIAQLLEPITFGKKDADGNDLTYNKIPTVDPYQYQNTIDYIDMKTKADTFALDGGTYIETGISPNTTMRLTCCYTQIPNLTLGTEYEKEMEEKQLENIKKAKERGDKKKNIKVETGSSIEEDIWFFPDEQHGGRVKNRFGIVEVKNMGKGAFAKNNIKKGKLLALFLSNDEIKNLVEDKYSGKNVNKENILALYCNHSDYPNTKPQMTNYGVYLFATRNIKENDKITVNYSEMEKLLSLEKGRFMNFENLEYDDFENFDDFENLEYKKKLTEKKKSFFPEIITILAVIYGTHLLTKTNLK